MPAQSRPFTRKTVYHRELRQASPVSISLLSHPRPSKFPDRLPFCQFCVEGEAGVYQLQVENAAVEEALRALPLNRYVTVAASGARDSAVLTVIDGDITLPFPPAPPAPAAPKAPTPAPAEPSIARSYAEALVAAEKLVSAYRKRFGGEPSEAIRCIATALYIERQRSAGRQPLTSTRSSE